ncbi:hypothetical protein [Aquitalea denitrificans]|uniref:hypothetical protein n=1 Tax=Aquitalea denitrificans TaxID=519081 RepID=UPI001F0F968C|nr:hypothetical protein [Aquitalea denitrificans]
MSKPSTTAIMKTARSERLEVTGFFSSWDAIGIGGQNALMARNIPLSKFGASIIVQCGQ